jgi:hypothetical protein
VPDRVDVAPDPAVALDQEIPQRPRRGHLGVLVEPAPPEAVTPSPLAEGEILRGYERMVPGEKSLGAAGHREAFAVDVQRAPEDALED